MRIPRPLALLVLGLSLASGCSRPFTAPPKVVGGVAVLPPANRTGDPLLVAGGSFLEEYAFRTEKVTVPEVLAAATSSFLATRGYTVVPGEVVEAVTGGTAPSTVEDAARIAAQGKLGGDALYLLIRRWESVDQSTPRAIIVGIDASLIDSSGRVVWSANRAAKPVQTQGAISQGTAYMIAVKAIVEELFGAWQNGGR